MRKKIPALDPASILNRGDMMKKALLPLLLVPVLLASCGGGISDPPAASFTIADKTVNIPAGADPFTATTPIARTNGFSSPIALNTSTIPAGIMLTFKSTPVTGTDPVTFNVAAPTAAPGTYTTTITGTGGGITASAKLTIIVSANTGNAYPSASPTAGGHAFQGTLTASTASGTGDLDCRDFTSQSEAQLYFNSKGGSITNNVDALDWNHNGVPCEVNEDWAIRSNRWVTPTPPVVTPPPPVTPTPPVVTPTPPVVTPSPPGTGGMCYVHGYYRSNGTYVPGYYRRC